jgi:hypothetical protein
MNFNKSLNVNMGTDVINAPKMFLENGVEPVCFSKGYP